MCVDNFLFFTHIKGVIREKMHLLDKVLSVSDEEIEFELRSFSYIPWENIFLNPRRLRGSDFLMRWSQGVWSEKRLTQAINETSYFCAIPYGPSSTAPVDDVRAFELYFKRLEKAGLGKIKRPDLLVFKKSDQTQVASAIQSMGGIEELPFIPEKELSFLLQKSVIAIECENSLWVAKKMPDYNSKLKPMKRLNGKLGLKKSAVLPTVILKEEDRVPLFKWQNSNNVQIHLWHVFFDRAYGISIDKIQKLIDEGLIEPTIQTFQAPGGATTKKAIYKIYYHYAYPLGISIEKPLLIPEFIEDKNGHILPYISFKKGKLKILEEALKILKEVCNNDET